MTKPFNPGDAVKITDRLAAALNATPKVHLDWRNRCGTVRRCNGHTVYVVWAGCTSSESLPLKAVELDRRAE